MTVQHTAPLEVHGYLINVMLSGKAQAAAIELQKELEQSFPSGIWTPPSGSLHITIMDWLSPLVDYGRDKKELFKELGPGYMETLADILKDQGTIEIAFNRIEAFPDAVIIKGQDDGSIQRIREQFRKRCVLLPKTKVQDSDFIHSTICRFKKDLDLEEVKKVVKRSPIKVEQRINEIWLSLEKGYGMQEYEVLRRFTL